MHILGTNDLEQSPRGKVLLNHNSTEYLRHNFEIVFSLNPVSTESTDGSSRSTMWGMERIELAQDTDMWRALVNTVMSLRVP